MHYLSFSSIFARINYTTVAEHAVIPQGIILHLEAEEPTRL